MANYTITKENGIKTIKEEVKNIIAEAISEGLKNKGIGELEKIRLETSTRGNNTFAVNIGTISENGVEFDFNYQIDIISKPFKDNKRNKAFNMETAKRNYIEWETKKIKIEE